MEMEIILGKKRKPDIAKIIGLEVLAIRSNKRDKGYPLEPDFIVFNDGITFIELEEQDGYAYHDCAQSARHIRITQNKERWEALMDNTNYIDCENDI